jgi:hypothetical protein
MSSIVISGDTSGSITLASPAVAGSNTVTMPAASGVCMVSGNMPAFRAYSSSTQTGVSANTATKVTLGTETFDTNNNFASSRFTPTVAGYYQINGSIEISGASFATYTESMIYKNGSLVAYNQYNTAGYASVWNTVTATVSDIVYCNGTTDYIELYGMASFTGCYFASGSSATYLSGALVRTA